MTRKLDTHRKVKNQRDRELQAASATFDSAVAPAVAALRAAEDQLRAAKAIYEDTRTQHYAAFEAARKDAFKAYNSNMQALTGVSDEHHTKIK